HAGVEARKRRDVATCAAHRKFQHAPPARGARHPARTRGRTSGVTSHDSLSSPPGFHLPQLNGLADGIAADEAEPTVIELTYHDTPDLRLARAGVTLLFRGDDGWVVKLGRETTTGPQLRHDEHRFEGAAGQPPAAAVDLVRALVRTARVAPVARLRTRRRRVELHDASDKSLGEVLDDEVTVLASGRVAARFRELEVEVDDAAP